MLVGVPIFPLGLMFAIGFDATMSPLARAVYVTTGAITFTAATVLTLRWVRHRRARGVRPTHLKGNRGLVAALFLAPIVRAIGSGIAHDHRINSALALTFVMPSFGFLFAAGFLKVPDETASTTN